jgi:phospholipase/carboxylesterase
MNEAVREIAGLRTLVVGDRAAQAALVLLHGYGTAPESLAPFSHSLNVPLLYLLPEGPLTAAAGGRGWWVSSLEEAHETSATAPRDLAALEPPGLDVARGRLTAFLDAAATEFQTPRWVLGGFSQGGMLALDAALRGAYRPAGLVLCSASRIALRLWAPHARRLAGLPVLLSHGTRDPDLAFHAGEALRDFLLAAGARVEWLPFEGGHEIPLIVWRAVRKFLRTLLVQPMGSPPAQ